MARLRNESSLPFLSSSRSCSFGAIDLSPSGAHLKLPAPEHRAERHVPRLGSFRHGACGLVYGSVVFSGYCCDDLETNSRIASGSASAWHRRVPHALEVALQGIRWHWG